MPASVFDPFSIRLAEEIGFEIGMVGGSSASLAVLGAPDLIVLTLTEFTDQCRRMSRAAALPFMVDADHGYGNALNVRRTVEELEAAGVAALSIEDTVLPLRYGQGGTELLSLIEGVGKMHAAIDARADASTLIVGRTSAAAVTGLDDAIARGKAYARAGVDALFFLGVKTAADVERLGAEFDLPIVLGGALKIMDAEALAAHGVRICLTGHPVMPAAVQAMHEALVAMREGREPANQASAALMRKVTRADDYGRWVCGVSGRCRGMRAVFGLHHAAGRAGILPARLARMGGRHAAALDVGGQSRRDHRDHRGYERRGDPDGPSSQGGPCGCRLAARRRHLAGGGRAPAQERPLAHAHAAGIRPRPPGRQRLDRARGAWPADGRPHGPARARLCPGGNAGGARFHHSRAGAAARAGSAEAGGRRTHDQPDRELWRLGGAEAARLIAAREITSEALVRACLDRIASRDAQVGAWIWLDPELALGQAREADRMLALGRGIGPLHGVPIGVKDIIETRDMPTQNGFRGHAGRHTHRDAFCVGQLRDAGAVILGKTVTTELAVRTPGKTMNPHKGTHTPGGSSSGSAAAVADGQVPLALGTQTGGSVIRPASFCGIHALKPTFGWIGRNGVTQMAPWLDTVGTYGRSVEDVALAAETMLALDPADPQAVPRSRPPLARIAMEEPPARPRLAFVRTPVWERADAAARQALEDFAAGLVPDCDEVELPGWMAEAWGWHHILQTYGIAQFYGPLADTHGELMSESLRSKVAEGWEMTEAACRHAIAQRDRVAAALDEIYAGHDAILCLSAAGTAPEGLDWTGDPIFNAFWTFAGVPCVNLPLLEVDLPLGVQLTGPRGGDGPLLRTARWLERSVA